MSEAVDRGAGDHLIMASEEMTLEVSLRSRGHPLVKHKFKDAVAKRVHTLSSLAHMTDLAGVDFADAGLPGHP